MSIRREIPVDDPLSAYTAIEVAEILGYTQKHVCFLCKSGELEAFRRGARGNWRITRSALEKWQGERIEDQEDRRRREDEAQRKREELTRFQNQCRDRRTREARQREEALGLKRRTRGKSQARKAVG